MILAHLGMSGSITHRHDGFDASEFDPRHDHLEFALDDATRLVYNDPRRFGMVRLISAPTSAVTAELKGIGPEPLQREFNADYLARAGARKKGRRSKTCIMDQRIVAGVGNIYASEILFHARRAADAARRPGEAREIDLIARVHAEDSARGDRQRRHHLSQLSRFARQARRFAKRLMVYGREGEPATYAATPIRTWSSASARVSIVRSASAD